MKTTGFGSGNDTDGSGFRVLQPHWVVVNGTLLGVRCTVPQRFEACNPSTRQPCVGSAFSLAAVKVKQRRRPFIAALHTPEQIDGRRQAVAKLTPADMQRISRTKRRRRQHQLESPTEPERIHAPLLAKYGDIHGCPEETLTSFAEDFVDELKQGQRGVYARLGERWNVKWPTARSRVLAAARRGMLVWTGTPKAPNGHLPGTRTTQPPGSFDQRPTLLNDWIEKTGSAHVPRGTIYRGAKLRSWMDSQRSRYHARNLNPSQVQALEAIEGWWWSSPTSTGNRAHPVE